MLAYTEAILGCITKGQGAILIIAGTVRGVDSCRQAACDRENVRDNAAPTAARGRQGEGDCRAREEEEVEEAFPAEAIAVTRWSLARKSFSARRAVADSLSACVGTVLRSIPNDIADVAVETDIGYDTNG